jgi:hypothetical protein
MIQAILDFIKGFTPDSKLPTGEYLARFASLSAVLLIIATAVYFAVSGTVLGARWGLVRTVADITNLSHYEAFALWGYQDRLRRATALIDDNFSGFDIPHSFYYK